MASMTPDLRLSSQPPVSRYQSIVLNDTQAYKGVSNFPTVRAGFRIVQVVRPNRDTTN